MKLIKNITLIIAVTFLFSSCYVSRMSRPILTGVIVDYNKNPIANCAVGETFTDKNGNFFLDENRYRKFTFIGYEAPPVSVFESIEKEGYHTKNLVLFNKYGGASPKGTKWDTDTIYLKSSTEEINYRKFIQHEWELSATKDSDTLFLIKKNFNEICKTRVCKDFYYDYDSHTENIWGSQRNLPDDVNKRSIDIGFLQNGTFLAQIILAYGEKGNHLAQQTKPNDTLETNGKWIVNKKSIELTSAYKELNGKFNFNQAEYEYIKLTK